MKFGKLTKLVCATAKAVAARLKKQAKAAKLKLP